MFLSKLYQVASASRVHLLQSCSVSSSRITKYGSNEFCCESNIYCSLQNKPEATSQGNDTSNIKSHMNNIHIYNLIDHITDLTCTDFKAYNKKKTSVLDNISKIREVSLPFDQGIYRIEECNDNFPIEDSKENPITPLKLHKGDLYWRRRRMRRHRLLRWRKRYKKLVLDRLQKRLNNRNEKEKDDLKNAWQAFGLSDEPPTLSKQKIDNLSKKWEEHGILIGLKREEMINFRKIEGIRKATDEGK